MYQQLKRKKLSLLVTEENLLGLEVGRGGKELSIWYTREH
jgi:hypothetical protein